MKSIILLAPPAAGKGTQSDLLCEKYGFVHISTGDLIREAVSNQDEMSAYLTEQMQSGKLVSDEIILKLLDTKLEEISNESGVVLDGFPRNLEQVEKARQYKHLNEAVEKDTCVIYLSVDYDLALKRIAGRISCPKCGHVYNDMIEDNQPTVKGICNHCQTVLTKRSDDNEDTFKVRFEMYLNQTEPLIAYYKEKGLLYEVDSSLSTAEVFKQIESIVDHL